MSFEGDQEPGKCHEAFDPAENHVNPRDDLTAYNSSCTITAGDDYARQPAAHQHRSAAQYLGDKAAPEPTATTAAPSLPPISSCPAKPPAKRKWWQQSHAGRQNSLLRTSSSACGLHSSSTSTVQAAPPKAQGAVAGRVQQQAAITQQQTSEAAGAGRGAAAGNTASPPCTAAGDAQHDSAVLCVNGSTGGGGGGVASAVRVNSSAAGRASGATGRSRSCVRITLLQLPQVITLGSLLAVRDAPIKQQVKGCTAPQAAAHTHQQNAQVQPLQQHTGVLGVPGCQQQRQEVAARRGDAGHQPLGSAQGFGKQQQQRQDPRPVMSSSLHREEGELSCEEGELLSDDEGQLAGSSTQQCFAHTAQVDTHHHQQHHQQQHYYHHQGQQHVPQVLTGQPLMGSSVAKKQQKSKSRAGRQVRDRKQRAAAERAASAAQSGSVSGEAGRVEVQAGLAADIKKWEKAHREANQHKPKAVDPARDLRFTILSDKPPCTFWHQGRCTKGAACTFSHAGRPAIHLLPCKFHQAGRCAKGDACRFSHEPGCVAPCRQLLLYGLCKVEACAAKHEALDPFIAQALRQYFLHLEQVDHDKQQQQQHQGKQRPDEQQNAAGRGCKRRRKKPNTQQQQQQQQHFSGASRGIESLQQAGRGLQTG